MRNYTVISKREELEFEIEGKHFFTSDTHFSHGNIIKYCKRPFMSGEEEFMLESGKHFRVSQSTIDLMNVTMVDRINAEVGPKDVLWHLGDFAWNGIGVVKEFLDKINCKNINLIWGNHDYPEMAKLFPNNWEQCLLIADGKHIHLNHYPQHSWEGSHHGWWHLFGHVHGGLDKNRLENPAWAMSMDIGVDSHDFYPKSLAQIESIFSKRDLEFKKFKDSMLPKETGGMAPV